MASNEPWSKSGVEPSVAELLADPVAQIILRYDGVTRADVWAAVERARQELRAAAGQPDARGRPVA